MSYFMLLFLLLEVKYMSSEYRPSVLNMTVDSGYNITLPCDLMGRSDVSWILGGKKAIGETQTTENGGLFISSLERNDTGKYVCTANDPNTSDNESGILAIVYLTVKSTPLALENVRVIPSSVLAVIQGNIVNDGGYPVNYVTVQFTQQNSSYWNTTYSSHINSLIQIDIYKLNPNSTYTFEIWASNKLGDGEKTTVTARTKYDIQEIELARHLLEGAETFDTRIWIVAVSIVTIALVVLTTGTCCVLYREYNVPEVTVEDPEKVELIPNVILNPVYYEELAKTKGKAKSTEIYLNNREGIKTIRV